MLNAKAFDRVLSKIIKSDQGLKKVILVDRTGLTIAHLSKFSSYPVDVDGIGAIASAVFCASEEQGNNLEIGGLNIVTSEFGTGKIFAAQCGRGVLCVISDPEVNLGMVRLVMKKASEELTSMLDEFLAGEPAVGVAEVTAGAVPALAEGRPSLEKDELEAALRELEKF